MKINTFWEYIDKCNFRKDLDEGRCGQVLLDLMPLQSTRDEFNDIFSILYNKLENSMNDTLEIEEKDYDEHIGLGDDSLSDLLSHIIGLGQEEYDKCLNNIDNLSAHAKGPFGKVEGYTESFSYAFLVEGWDSSD